MNSSSNAIHWILDNRKALNLRVKTYDWGISQNSIYDSSVCIDILGSSYEGRGSGLSEEEALLKAFSEAAERSVFSIRAKEPTSSGYAANTSLTNAKSAATFELIERDRFFCHFLTKQAFHEPSISLESLSISKSVIDYLHENQIEFQLAEMRPLNDIYSFIFMAHDTHSHKKLGFMFGLGCNSSKIKAAHSAVLEGLRHSIYGIKTLDKTQNSQQHLTLSKFKQKQHWLPEDHLSLASNIDYATNITEFFFKLSHKVSNESERFDLESIIVEELELPPLLKDSPLKVVRASSEKLQTAFFGPTKANHVNLERMSRFVNRNLSWSEINQTPHPLG